MLDVARHLRPEDIFSLSFTNKLNYQLISSVDGIWKRARLRYTPARRSLPPRDMTEKEYAWFLSNSRCSKCDIGDAELKFDWVHIARCCDDCLCMIRDDPNLLNPRESRTRSIESIEESRLLKMYYMKKVRDLGEPRVCGSGKWDSAILAEIPFYENILLSQRLTPTENEFQLLKTRISEGTCLLF
jgi:hypothetical protein